MTDLPHDLFIHRHLRAPRAAVWHCWSEPDLLMQWFFPKPWGLSACTLDLHAGGTFDTTMNGPAGGVFENRGIVLEVVPTVRLVSANLMSAGFRPAMLPALGFAMTAIATFVDTADGGTDYRWAARHATQADSDRHAASGFDAGWNAATDQLEALARTL